MYIVDMNEDASCEEKIGMSCVRVGGFEVALSPSCGDPMGIDLPGLPVRYELAHMSVYFPTITTIITSSSATCCGRVSITYSEIFFTTC